MKISFADLLNPKAWGTALARASSDAPSERKLEVYRQTTDAPRLVGTLSLDQDEFVFRYVSGYDMDPISAFPMIDEEYRSRHLWPFFAVRIPPIEREDMQEKISSRLLEKDQIIEILGLVARVSVTNPYEFRLEGD
ncbi:MAG: hypothetical protein OXG98_02820 [Gemmatimonadetes bacterium]|nr:hypothetical protein [Gemmatimonadota bacterium]